MATDVIRKIFASLMRRTIITNRQEPYNDGLGSDLVDRDGGKPRSAGGGGGSDIDPRYDDALRILGREGEIPSQWQQQVLEMSNQEAADLARRLTSLDKAVKAEKKPVQDFIAALQEIPPDQQKLNSLHQEIVDKGNAAVREALEKVCEYPGVQAKLTGKDR